MGDSCLKRDLPADILPHLTGLKPTPSQVRKTIDYTEEYFSYPRKPIFDSHNIGRLRQLVWRHFKKTEKSRKSRKSRKKQKKAEKSRLIRFHASSVKRES